MGCGVDVNVELTSTPWAVELTSTPQPMELVSEAKMVSNRFGVKGVWSWGQRGWELESKGFGVGVNVVWSWSHMCLELESMLFGVGVKQVWSWSQCCLELESMLFGVEVKNNKKQKHKKKHKALMEAYSLMKSMVRVFCLSELRSFSRKFR